MPPRFRRPLLCTEYMSRPVNSKFGNILPYLKAEKIAAYNWGLVSGRTQTIYAWQSRASAVEPEEKR